MKFHTQYEVTEDLSLLAAKQAFKKVYLKQKWIMILVVFVASIVTVFSTTNANYQLAGYIGLAFSVILATLWVKSYFSTLSHSKSSFHSTGGGVMDVDISDDYISISTESSSRNIKMDMVTSVLETKDFLVILSKKTPVFMPLKSMLNPEVTDWLLNKKMANKSQ